MAQAGGCARRVAVPARSAHPARPTWRRRRATPAVVSVVRTSVLEGCGKAAPTVGGLSPAGCQALRARMDQERRVGVHCPHGIYRQDHHRAGQAGRQALYSRDADDGYDVLEYLASGMTQEEILDDFPYLEAADIRACLLFAADRERKMVTITLE